MASRTVRTHRARTGIAERRRRAAAFDRHREPAQLLPGDQRIERHASHGDRCEAFSSASHIEAVAGGHRRARQPRRCAVASAPCADVRRTRVRCVRDRSVRPARRDVHRFQPGAVFVRCERVRRARRGARLVASARDRCETDRRAGPQPRRFCRADGRDEALLGAGARRFAARCTRSMRPTRGAAISSRIPMSEQRSFAR